MADHDESMSASPAEWSACESGELRGLGDRLRTAHRDRQRLRAITGGAIAAAAAAVLIAVIVPASGPSGANAVATISCETCYDRFASYHAHVTSDAPMAADAAAEVARHLEECDVCRPKFEEEYPGVLSALVPAGVGFAVFALRSRRQTSPRDDRA